MDQWNRKERAQKLAHTCMVNWSSTKETRISNGEKIVSLASGVGKPELLHVNQWS